MTPFLGGLWLKAQPVEETRQQSKGCFSDQNHHKAGSSSELQKPVALGDGSSGKKYYFNCMLCGELTRSCANSPPWVQPQEVSSAKEPCTQFLPRRCLASNRFICAVLSFVLGRGFAELVERSKYVCALATCLLWTEWNQKCEFQRPVALLMAECPQLPAFQIMTQTRQQMIPVPYTTTSPRSWRTVTGVTDIGVLLGLSPSCDTQCNAFLECPSEAVAGDVYLVLGVATP